MRFLLWLIRAILLSILLALAAGTAVISGFALYLGPQLPKIDSILDLKLQTPLKIISSDGLLLGEFGEMRREPLPYSALPPSYVNAVLAAEDDRFFTHGGVDPTGLARAATELVKTGHIRSGGSTITMQLARNFFLSSEKSFIRKFNEILLSIQLERTLQKEQIFGLYVNKIYLGHKAYGAQSAAYVYYGKTLDQLSLAQWAMLAGLPKAPSKYNPLVNPERALIRRNWILGRMLSLGYIDKATHDKALAEPETAIYHGLKTDIDAPYIAEMARQFAVEKLGNEAYNGGYIVRTTVDSRLQLEAQKAVWDGAVDYDKRHGYRGAEKHFPTPPLPAKQMPSYWAVVLRDYGKVGDLEPAIVASINKSSLTLVLPNNRSVTLNWSAAEAKRLQPYKSENYVAPAPKNFSEVFQVGDLIRLHNTGEDKWEISQIPRIQAALASLNSKTGAVIALSGGIDFTYSKFNRAAQALRQPGSSFKPFIYLKALENGYTPATLVDDSPIVFQEAGMSKPWRPENHGGTYLGMIPLRQALYQSRNMVAIRLLQSIGVKSLINSLPRFGFDTKNMDPNLSIALGSHAFTPLTMATAYTALSNGGFKVEPFLVQQIADPKGNIIYQQKYKVACADCAANTHTSTDNTTELAPRVIDEQTAYIIDNMLKDVIRRGTGHAATVLNRSDIAGKTGTTNGPTDVWFVGYNPAITTAAWVGFDDNTMLGKREFGGTAALPIWISYMREALKDQPVIERAMPAGLVTVRAPANAEQPTDDTEANGDFEIFRGDETEGGSSLNGAEGETSTSSDDYLF